MALTPIEKQMKFAGLIYAILFIVTALAAFILKPDLLLTVINRISAVLFPSLPAYPAGENKFWLSMTVSMMVGVTITSLFIYWDVKKYYIMAIPLIGMKLTSAICGLGFFLAGLFIPKTGWHTLANLIIFITDFPLGALMLYFYFRVDHLRKKENAYV